MAVAGSSTPTIGPLQSGPLGTGLVTLSAGVLQANSPLTLGNALTLSATTANSPMTFSGSPITFSGATTLSGANVFNISNTTTLAGAIASGSGALTLEGSGTLQLTAAAAYTGATTVLGGSLVLSNLGTALSSSGFFVDQGGTLTLDNTAINLPDAGISGVAGRVGGRRRA